MESHRGLVWPLERAEQRGQTHPQGSSHTEVVAASAEPVCDHAVLRTHPRAETEKVNNRSEVTREQRRARVHKHQRCRHEVTRAALTSEPT